MMKKRMNQKISEVLSAGRSILERNNIDVNEARMLLAFVLDVTIENLYTLDECTSNQFAKFLVLLEKRVNGEPFAYLVGYKEFMKLKFEVNRNVLIPRPETELLVEKVLSIIKPEDRVLDLCTGSGCIGISLKKYFSNCIVSAIDISNDALDIAKKNALNNNVNIEFIQSDLFENVDKVFDVIVSNPPYISTSVISTLQEEVKREPFIALDGGENGLDIYKKIATQAKEYLKDSGYLCLEIGYDQSIDICNLLETEGYRDIEVIKDLSNNDRNIICRK